MGMSLQVLVFNSIMVAKGPPSLVAEEPLNLIAGGLPNQVAEEALSLNKFSLRMKSAGMDLRLVVAIPLQPDLIVLPARLHHVQTVWPKGPHHGQTVSMAQKRCLQFS
jgi:hypothetical protein